MTAPDITLPGLVKVVPPLPAIQVVPPDPTVHLVPVSGPAGPPGAAGVDWFTGHGPPTPENTVGATLGDMYQDLDTGLLYQLN